MGKEKEGFSDSMQASQQGWDILTELLRYLQKGGEKRLGYVQEDKNANQIGQDKMQMRDTIY